MIALIMLNLSSAFYAFDHLILLKGLEFSFGINEKALTWVKSYLTDRTQCISVCIKHHQAYIFILIYHMDLFWDKKIIVCMRNQLIFLYKRHNIKYNCNTDYTEVYIILKACDKWDVSSSTEA